MSTFELIASGKEPGLAAASEQVHLGSAIHLNNARWFTKVRWIVALVFTVAGLVGILMPGVMKSFGIILPSKDLWILAGVLVLANTFFRGFGLRLKEDPPRRTVEAYIWLQIVTDLMVVTILVHIIGSTVTFVAFTYLFHIALACIFFPKRYSLLVALLAAGLYLTMITLEITGVWPAVDILITDQYMDKKDPSMAIFFAVSAVFIWLVVWYLVSTLSEAVRKRDQQLSAANERLVRADHEKTQQVLVTTHELKAPFAGIESNIQVLKYQYWNEIPEHMRVIINQIDVRAQTLRERIREILILGELKSQPTGENISDSVDLQLVIKAVLEDLDEKAKERRIALDIKVPSINVPGDMERFTILFSNLVSNAIFYSHEGGRVEVLAKQGKEEARVSVSDFGIGIRTDALPHIFDEYFRTKEAARFNKMSTGLGLSMVKEIARNTGLGIRVTSELGKGTTFEVLIPKK